MRRGFPPGTGTVCRRIVHQNSKAGRGPKPHPACLSHRAGVPKSPKGSAPGPTQPGIPAADATQSIPSPQQENPHLPPRTWYCLELSLPTAAENLALDEALWHWVCLRGECPRPLLRIWECPQRAVVLGRASCAEQEVHLRQCRRDEAPVLRRPTGGAAVVIGPGCRMFSLFWPAAVAPPVPPAAVHSRVLSPLAETLSRLGPEISLAGISDLVHRQRKISGNSLRWNRHGWWYHGTLLYEFELSWLERWLKHPPREPQYRRQRPHGRFVGNAPFSAGELDEALRRAWGETTPLRQWPAAETARLYARRYTSPDWNLQR